MGIDDDEEENHEDDVCDISKNLPDLMEGVISVARERLDDEEIFNNSIESVSRFGEEAGRRTDEPAKRARFVITGVGCLSG